VLFRPGLGRLILELCNWVAGTRIGTPATTLIPILMGTRMGTLMVPIRVPGEPSGAPVWAGQDASRGGVTRKNRAWLRPLRSVGVPPASRLGRARTLHAGMPWGMWAPGPAGR
jgi:hypothetical protein